MLANGVMNWKHQAYHIKVHALAVSAHSNNHCGGGRKSLYLLSCVCPSTTAKAVSAAMHIQKGRIVPIFKFSGTEVADDYDGCFANCEGYDVYRHKLGTDLWHIMAVCNQPDFMPVVSREALMHKLREPEHDTPVLWPGHGRGMEESWLPWLFDALQDREILAHSGIAQLDCFGCESGYLVLPKGTLDKVVEYGVEEGKLQFG